MALEDLAMMRAIEGAVVLYPSEGVSAENAVRLAADTRGIVYIRSSRPKTPVIYASDEKFQIGKSKVVRESNEDKLTIVAGGVTLFEALKAYEKLKAEGISIRVIDIFSVKPIDSETLIAAGRATCGLMLTVEDHSNGGIGDAVASAVSPEGIHVHQLYVKEVPRSGKPEELLAAYGIDTDAIIRKIRTMI
jgi:transketolase